MLPWGRFATARAHGAGVPHMAAPASAPGLACMDASPPIASRGVLIAPAAPLHRAGAKRAVDAFTPTGALLKAVIIGGASPIGGLDLLTDKPLLAGPSFAQGFGRINLGGPPRTCKDGL